MSLCKKTTDGQEPLGRLIYHMAQDLSRFGEKLLSPHGLTLEQMQILKSLPFEEGLTQKDLGGIVNKTPANLTRLLDRLEGKKLLTRKKSPTDRRATLIFLTKKGIKLVGQVEEIFESFSSQFIKGVTKKDQTTMRNSFAKMSKNIQKMSNKVDNK